MKYVVLALSAVVAFCNAGALQLVESGEPLAQIVIAHDPMPQVKLAATELRDHIRRMSGVELQTVSEPQAGFLPIYVGESEHTRKLGLTLEGVEKDGYRICVTEDYVALFGHDKISPFYPRGHKNRNVRAELLQEWQEYTGEKWDFPFLQIYDPRNFNEEFGFSLFDPSGTLFAVYELLEQLGVRWYMPDETVGTLIPEKAEIAVAEQDLKRTPVFGRRYLRFGWGSRRSVFLWSKRLRLGLEELAWMSHGTSEVTAGTKEEHPEYLAVVNGRLQDQGDYGPGQARLATPLRDAMIRYGNKFFERYPELRHFSAGPNDGYTVLDDRDREAGWQRQERGSRGELSDYVWTFINEVAAGVAEKYPDKFTVGLAYSRYRAPPEDIEKLHPGVGVVYCQHRSDFVDSNQFTEAKREREVWLEKLPSREFYIWDYYLWHRKGRALWGVPVIFWKTLQADLQDLRGKSHGEYIEAWSLQGEGSLWGLNHMTIWLHARLCWQPEEDLEGLLTEYYRRFYGAAEGEMREFFEFAENVWARPAPRQAMIPDEDGAPQRDGFLRPEDVPRYFEILERALEKVGEGPERTRIEMIRAECEPMNNIFSYHVNYNKGMEALKARNGAAAVEYLEKAVEQATDNRSRADSAYRLGTAYRDLLQDGERALKAWQVAMETQIVGAGAAVRLHARMDSVELLRKAGRYEEALALLDGGAGMKRHDYWWGRNLTSRGLIAEELGKPEEAAACYREGLQLRDISKAQAEWLRKRLENM